MNNAITFALDCYHVAPFSSGALIGGIIFGSAFYVIGCYRGRSALAEEMTALHAKARAARAAMATASSKRGARS